ncbi:Uncharacterised protein [Candidatus Anstonella stagnisolia]|nr:Uncharacterised protein [Candidatus Anstonella stagnisolia]
MKYAFLALTAFFSFFLFGCINAPSSTCPPADSNCIYTQAVLQQDPYVCYNLPESQREVCFKAAANPLEKKKLQGRQAIAPFAQPQPTAQQAQAASPSLPENQTDMQKALANCPASSDSDSCFFSLAKENSAVLICDRVKSKQVRDTCISNVAISSKKPAECSLLATEDEKTLCLSFSSG